MKYIKLYEDLEFDPNNFRKLRKDIKAITIELKDNGFKIQPFEVENDNEFDNFDFFVKIYRGQSSMNKWGFTFDEVEEYIEMIKDYVDNYYTYSNLVVFYDGTKRIKYSDDNYSIQPTDRITQVEIEIGDIKKK
jgi:hypothetical protein